jgi:2-haloacid dehalogenase
VDWYSSVVRELDSMKLGIDSNAFALAWRAGYGPAMQRVASGQLAWMRIDDLHRMILDDLLQRFGISTLDDDQIRELNMVWHRLNAWPDAVEGLTRLKTRYTVCSLSNGNISLLTDLAKHARLPWDCVLSAEMFKKYKPDPATYLGVASLLGVTPQDVMMVAAHQDDLVAARACGLQTAFIERPDEFGPTQPTDVSPQPANTLHAKDMIALAAALGC